MPYLWRLTPSINIYGNSIGSYVCGRNNNISMEQKRRSNSKTYQNEESFPKL